MQLGRRAWIRTIIAFCAVFILLIVPWPNLGRAYVSAFTTVWTSVVRVSTQVRETGFELRPETPVNSRAEWSAAAFVRNGRAERKVNSVDLRRASYLPTAVYLALVLTIVRRIKGRAAIARSVSGFLLLQIVPTILLTILLHQAGVIKLGAAAETALMIGYRSVISSPGMTYALPAGVWAAVHRDILWLPTIDPRVE